MLLYSYSYFRVIPKISQATGLRDLNCGCSLSPLSFPKAGCSGNHGFQDPLLPPPVPCGAMTVIGVSPLPQVRWVMIVLDKIKAFFKWYGEGVAILYRNPEAKGAGKKAAEPPRTKVAEAPEEKGDESSAKWKNGPCRGKSGCWWIGQFQPA